MDPFVLCKHKMKHLINHRSKSILNVIFFKYVYMSNTLYKFRNQFSPKKKSLLHNLSLTHTYSHSLKFFNLMIGSVLLRIINNNKCQFKTIL